MNQENVMLAPSVLGKYTVYIHTVSSIYILFTCILIVSCYSYLTDLSTVIFIHINKYIHCIMFIHPKEVCTLSFLSLLTG